MQKQIIIVLVFLCTISTYPQQFFIHGKVEDKSTGEPLSYGNIRVMNSTLGTAANKEGKYELKLDKGTYKLIASFIGYISDTLTVVLNSPENNINFLLSQTNITLPEIMVRPGDNPALRIIRKAIETKKRRDKILHSYEFEAYTKGIIKTQKDFSSRDNSVDLNIGKDTSALKITGILENESKGYYKKPDNYKEVIIARKQSANFPPTINTLTGGRILQNFYDNKINFLGKDLPGPLSNNSLNYYYFYLTGTSAIDNKTVYKIFMSPDDPDDPGFVGDLFITDSTYDLIKVELGLNRAANTGGLFDSVDIFQQFSEFNDSVYMPIDYRLFVKLNFLNLAKIGFELNTILYDYQINPNINDKFFNKAILTVLPGADNKDSTYWKNVVIIPNTKEEQTAYTRIDSLESIPRTFWNDFSPLSTRMNLSKHFSVSAPLGMYHFNRVEGNALDFGMFLKQAVNRRFNSLLQFSYGFADKRVKTNFDASYLLGDYRTYKLSFNAFNELNVLFGNSDNYNELTSTILALVAKNDFRDYYYSGGFNFRASGEVFPVLSLYTGYSTETDKNAFKNTEFSIFSKNRSFPKNLPVFETKVNSIKAGFNFDFRDYIEDGFFRRRTSLGKSFITFGGSIIISDKNYLNSDVNFTTYEFRSRGVINTFNSAKLNFRIFGMYTKGELPYQLLYSLPGNIDLTAQNYTFRTLNMNEILGDRVVTLNLEHDFGDQLFRLLKIPILKDMELQLNTFLNIAYSDAGNQTKAISPYSLKSFKHPFFEIGFGIGQILFPLQLDFSWKLNYRDGNNFRFGINSFIF